MTYRRYRSGNEAKATFASLLASQSSVHVSPCLSAEGDGAVSRWRDGGLLCTSIASHHFLVWTELSNGMVGAINSTGLSIAELYRTWPGLRTGAWSG